MKQITRLLALTFAIIIPALALQVSAETVTPFSVPTISSTTCSQCGDLMELSDELRTYEQVSVHICGNVTSPADGVNHLHRITYIYHMYLCPTCGNWGQIYIGSIDECGLAIWSISPELK